MGYCLTKRELLRIRHVNEMKRIANFSSDYKLVYGPGGNLTLMGKKGKRWILLDETGPWVEDYMDDIGLDQ